MYKKKYIQIIYANTTTDIELETQELAKKVK